MRELTIVEVIDMNGFLLVVGLLLGAIATLVSSFRHVARASIRGNEVVNQGKRRHAKGRYKYEQGQQGILREDRYSGSSITTTLYNTVKEALMSDPDFEIFSRLLKQADLEDIETSIGMRLHATIRVRKSNLLLSPQNLLLSSSNCMIHLCRICHMSHVTWYTDPYSTHYS